MARTPTIRYQMKHELNQMAYYGHSKHEEQCRTYEERQRLKAQGASREECMKIDYTADKIFSYTTMKTYQNEIDRFANYLEDMGIKKCTMTEAKEHIQDYLDYQKERGLSAYSVHTTCAALCKTFHTKMKDYDIPNRKLSDITRSRGIKPRDTLNEQRASVALEANRILGLRRSELRSLRVNAFQDNGTEIRMTPKGKGGKTNTTIFRDTREIEAIRNLLEDKKSNEYVFDRQQFKNDADFHQTRAEAFQARYQRYVDEMKVNPEKRAEYQKIIRDTFEEHHKEVREDLNKPYYCRGSHRKDLEEKGLNTVYDRTAVMMVSLESHFRSGVLVDHYLAK